MEAFKFETYFSKQIIATFRRANNYLSLIMKCMELMMHFHIQTINEMSKMTLIKKPMENTDDCETQNAEVHKSTIH